MRVAITGATGYIGTSLTKYFRSQGVEVIALSRREPKNTVESWYHYELSSDEFHLPITVDAIIHLATNTNGSELNQQMEIIALDRLLDVAEASRAAFVFMSSQSANEVAVTPYGRMKWLQERKTLQRNGIVIRLGQVYGNEASGLFGRIVGLVNLLPVLPNFLPAPTIQPIHIDDLTYGVGRILEKGNQGERLYCLGAIEPVTFTYFVQMVAKYRLGKYRVFIPFPTALMSALASLASENSPLSRLRSLFTLNYMDSKDDLHSLNLELRDLESGLQRTGKKRREIIEEALVLYEYVLGVKPNVFSTRTYVRAIEKLKGKRSLEFPIIVDMYPSLLSLFEGSSFLTTEEDLIWRIETASILAEASSLGAKQFLNLTKPSGFIASLSLIVFSIFSEVSVRVIRIVIFPFLLIHGFFNRPSHEK